MKDYMKIYQEWLSNPYFDEATAKNCAIEGNENEIKERFYMDLEFGTAWFRRYHRRRYQPMNIKTCYLGLANYNIKQEQLTRA